MTPATANNGIRSERVTVLVTGGAGRLGRSVVTGLADAGYAVVSVDRDSAPAGTFPASVI